MVGSFKLRVNTVWDRRLCVFNYYLIFMVDDLFFYFFGIFDILET